jgi:hypothetical protein
MALSHRRAHAQREHNYSAPMANPAIKYAPRLLQPVLMALMQKTESNML